MWGRTNFIWDKFFQEIFVLAQENYPMGQKFSENFNFFSRTTIPITCRPCNFCQSDQTEYTRNYVTMFIAVQEQ